MYEKVNVVPAGTTTAQNPGPTVTIGDTCWTLAFTADVTAAGGTPVFTWKIQGSVDGVKFYDIFYITDASDTPATAARSNTTAGTQQIIFVSQIQVRKYKFFRAVTTDTNVTYGIDAWLIGN